MTTTVNITHNIKWFVANNSSTREVIAEPLILYKNAAGYSELLELRTWFIAPHDTADTDEYIINDHRTYFENKIVPEIRDAIQDWNTD